MTGCAAQCDCRPERREDRRQAGEKVAAANRQSTFVAISQDDGWKDRGTGELLLSVAAWSDYDTLFSHC